MSETPVSKNNPPAGCHDIGVKEQKASTNVQMINGMLGLDTPEKQLKSGITNGIALTLQKLIRNPGIERDGSSNYFPQNVNK